MKREIIITLQYGLAIGKVNLNEIVYKLKEVRCPLMLRILEEILKSYDDLILERLIVSASINKQITCSARRCRTGEQLWNYVIRLSGNDWDGWMIPW